MDNHIESLIVSSGFSFDYRIIHCMNLGFSSHHPSLKRVNDFDDFNSTMIGF